MLFGHYVRVAVGSVKDIGCVGFTTASTVLSLNS